MATQFDPWAAYNNALAGLQQNMLGAYQVNRQREQDALAQQQAAQQAELNQLKLGEAAQAAALRSSRAQAFKDFYLPDDVAGPQLPDQMLPEKFYRQGDYEMGMALDEKIAKNAEQRVPKAKAVQELRKEYTSRDEVKNWNEVSRQVDVMGEAMKQLGDIRGGKANNRSLIAIDQALITLYNKMMDPTSVVRESEYARTPQDAALLNRLEGTYGRVIQGGQALKDEDRAAIYEMAMKFAEASQKKAGDVYDFYTREATNINIDDPLRAVGGPRPSFTPVSLDFVYRGRPAEQGGNSKPAAKQNASSMSDSELLDALTGG